MGATHPCSFEYALLLIALVQLVTTTWYVSFVNAPAQSGSCGTSSVVRKFQKVQNLFVASSTWSVTSTKRGAIEPIPSSSQVHRWIR